MSLPSPTRPSSPFCYLQLATMTIMLRLTYPIPVILPPYRSFKMIPVQNLCGIPSFAFTTAANHYFLYSAGCMHLSPSIPTFPHLRNPSTKPVQPLIIFSKKTTTTSHRRAFFNLPERTITCPAAAACISYDPPTTLRVDLDVCGRFITLRLGPNFRVTNANMYENRWRYSYPADG